ncbi:phage tail protein [Rahnella aceris]|uniref:phage tail protein n=1 Tax=Rahnella sp. (strain Y9602) TaxID=2703885 RepID=UPI001C271812|nr:phage tail protein [Rahnella aceris]MBU9851991.1 phage tail protein [Rahnella aceris]
MQKIGNITPTADANGEWTNGNVAAGTPPTIIDAAWLNTIQREIANVVTGAGLTLDPANDAQLLAALLSLTGPGRLLAVKYITASTTYTPNAGTKKIFVQGIGTGGNGGGSIATNSTGCTACSGGAAGSYAQAWYTTGFSSVTVTIGAIGAANYAAGSAGGTSSFGSLMVVPGGGGGPVSAQTTSVAFWSAGVGSPGVSPTLSGHVSGIGGQGQPGFNGQVYSGVANSGVGGSSSLGGGGVNSSGGSGGGATGYGAGGAGAGMPPNSAQTYGGNGSKGLFIVWEYA